MIEFKELSKRIDEDLVLVFSWKYLIVIFFVLFVLLFFGVKVMEVNIFIFKLIFINVSGIVDLLFLLIVFLLIKYYLNVFKYYKVIYEDWI